MNSIKVGDKVVINKSLFDSKHQDVASRTVEVIEVTDTDMIVQWADGVKAVVYTNTISDEAVNSGTEWETKIISLTIAGETREVEIVKFWGGENGRTERWETKGQVALAKLGHGKKLWAVGVTLWRDNENTPFRPAMRCTINNRTNGYIVAWNDLEKTDNRRSQHNSQYTKR